MPNTNTRPTWDELVAHEPELDKVLIWCRLRCGNNDWRDYSKAKAWIARLVGWDSGKDGWLGSSEAYMAAIDTITEALDL